ncbi:type I DNA topoisomerase [Patescibacteria group bacterium]
MKSLVIVESPTKAKTITRFLGKDFKVESSLGHMRDLPKGELGVDIENNFEPRYVIPKKSQKNVNKLKKFAKEFDKIILATDEDREGEAIAWHLLEALDLKKRKPEEIERIAFHEITKSAIEKALENPRPMDLNLVDAQQARRILDRLVGYKLSPFLWKKLMRGLSAGRVQSVALRLIIDRENEIRKFKPEDYWSISATLISKKQKFPADLIKIDGKQIIKPGITDKKIAETALKDLKDASWAIESIEKKKREQQPRPPFTTSTIQQAAHSNLYFSAKKTMMVAQQLYEGINLKKEGGALGLITYMRTDSFSVAPSAVESATKYLKDNLGEKYTLSSPRVFKTKSKGAQEAHEAIRPTHPELSPESIKDDLSADQFKLYDLIWRRFMATQMPNAIFDNTTINTLAGKYLFRSHGSVLKFDGFLKIYFTPTKASGPSKMEDNILPEVSKEDVVSAKEVISEAHQTQPPARYNDASLVKILEKHEIGRPSTYAQIISTIQSRNYVEKDEAKRFIPTEIGEKVNKIMVDHFPDIVDVDFTAELEDKLDKVAEGKIKYKPLIKTFYIPFEKNLEEKYKTVKEEDLTEETDEVCEICSKPMIIKYGRFGKFMACSGFPDCKNTKSLSAKELNIKCPLCKEKGDDGDVISRKTKKGRIFFGCSGWPKCKFATWNKPTGELCPECKEPTMEIKNEIKCSNKECTYSIEKPH